MKKSSPTRRWSRRIPPLSLTRGPLREAKLCRYGGRAALAGFAAQRHGVVRETATKIHRSNVSDAT